MRSGALELYLSLVMQEREQFDWQFDLLSIIYFSDTGCACVLAHTYSHIFQLPKGALDRLIILYRVCVCVCVCVCVRV